LSGFDLTRFNTLGFHAKANHGLIVHHAEDLPEITRSIRGQPRVILGCGSNVVIHQDLPAVALVNRIKGRSINAQGLLCCGAGENWHDTVMWSLEQGWAGLENMALIPGTVGASPVQNIGAYGVELKDVFVSLTAWDFQTESLVEFTKAQCRFGYRDSIFKDPAIQGPWNAPRYFITQVCMQLVPVARAKVNLAYGDLQKEIRSQNPLDVAQAVIRIRESKLPDPAKLGNVGSFFKNPIVAAAQAQALKAAYPGLPVYSMPEDPAQCKVSAGWLIDQAGFKARGRNGGGAGDLGVGDGAEDGVGVYEKHALVLVNYGRGTAAELLQLAQTIQSTIKARFGIALESEPSWLPPISNV
jgi:UDP-N-acetylmuramate dehydrogenase